VEVFIIILYDRNGLIIISGNVYLWNVLALMSGILAKALPSIVMGPKVSGE